MTIQHTIELTKGDWRYKIGSSFQNDEWTHIYFSAFNGTKYKGHSYDSQWMFEKLIPEYIHWYRDGKQPEDERVLQLIERLNLKEDQDGRDGLYETLEQAGRSSMFDWMIEGKECPNLAKESGACKKMCLTRCIDGYKFP